jgi:HD-GYP domain-containing protein (c-di-GMP phosphodiesterase class II)
MIDLAAYISQAADLVDRALVDHHKEVALIGGRIAREMGLSERTCDNVVVAALVHDIGSLSVGERLATVRFDYDDGFRHCEPGYLLLRQYEPFQEIARIVRMHHVQWCDGAGDTYLGEPVPLESHVIHLADRAAVLVSRSVPVLDQRDTIVQRIVEKSGSRFLPEAVDAFVRLAREEVFWLDLVSIPSGAQMLEGLRMEGSGELEGEDMASFARMISRIVDFRSVFTATHTAGVASTAVALAALLGMDQEDQAAIGVAGSLHDVGKLAVPSEILEKPGPLDAHEWAQMKTHTYYTYKVLTAGKALSRIAGWAAYHHERLDESGYPFHIGAEGLDEGSRLMAVADIFTAVSEDRPYRAGMKKDQTMAVLREGAANKATDPRIVEALIEDFEHINDVRVQAQTQRRDEFADFERALEKRAMEFGRARPDVPKAVPRQIPRRKRSAA